MIGAHRGRRELLALREQHGFLLVIDDAHATLVCDRSRPEAPPVARREQAVSTAAEEAAAVADMSKHADIVVGEKDAPQTPRLLMRILTAP